MEMGGGLGFAIGPPIGGVLYAVSVQICYSGIRSSYGNVYYFLSPVDWWI